MKIRDVMTDNVQYVEPDRTLADIARLMKDHDCGAIPVAKNNKLVGMITDRDIVIRCVAMSEDPTSMKAEHCMSPGILYCYDTDDVQEVVRNMGDQAIRRLPVVNKDKDLIGIISLGDLSAACENKEQAGETMADIRKAA